MRVGEVVDVVWATRKAECLQGHTFLVIKTNDGEIVAADRVGAGPGDRVMVVSGFTASRYCEGAPVDAAAVAIVDVKKV